MPTNIRDPRSIVTPDAFGIDDALLGTPLADPWRRFWAMMIDLVAIGILTVMTGSIQLLVWGVVALFILRMAFQRSGRASQAAALLLRVFAGCLGLTILSTVVVVFLVLRSGGDDGPRVDREAVARQGIEAAEEPGGTDQPGVGSGPAPEGPGPTAEAEESALTDAEALAEWARLVTADTAGDPALSDREEALRGRVLGLVAADTLARLEASLEEARDDAEDYREDVEDLREELDEREGGFTDLLEDVWHQAGSAIGLWSLYFTVLLTVWKGQTVGKRAVGVRVVRLDGEPMTWWSSFERAGGYVAGIATGLLGFAQVFWDPNRQCIHDKIVGTVVVREGAAAVPGAWLESHGATDPLARRGTTREPMNPEKGERP